MVDRYKVVVGEVTATAHAAAHPDGQYVSWHEYEALRAEVEAHKRSRQIDANEARSREMELRQERERLRATLSLIVEVGNAPRDGTDYTWAWEQAMALLRELPPGADEVDAAQPRHLPA